MDAPISSPTATTTRTTYPQTTTTRPASSLEQSPPAAAAKFAPPPPPPPPREARTPSSTDAFLKDFTLVAEAAKRAQMAVLMRDFEGVALS